MDPADDLTSIGSILINLGIITNQQLRAAIEDKHRTAPDELLGLFMVGREIITREQLKKALKTQQQLRGNGKTARALAQADIASACIGKAMSTAIRVYDRVHHRHGNNGANAAEK
jgi:hypothetical protein